MWLQAVVEYKKSLEVREKQGYSCRVELEEFGQKVVELYFRGRVTFCVWYCRAGGYHCNLRRYRSLYNLTGLPPPHTVLDHCRYMSCRSPHTLQGLLLLTTSPTQS